MSYRTGVQSRQRASSWQKPAMTTLQTLPLSKLAEAPRNVRKSFGDLSEMAKSIEAQGIIEPIVVRRLNSGTFEIVAGHRRARAAKMAGLKEVDVIVRNLDEEQALTLMLVENTERESLHVLELAEGYRRLMDDFKLTGEQAAERIGLKKATFYNVVSLLQLTEPVRQALEQGKVSASVAYQLVRVRGERLQAQALNDVLKLSKGGKQPAIRAVERLVRSRYLQEAKAGQTKQQREVKEHGAEVALRRRVMKLLPERLGEVIERKRLFDDTDLRWLTLLLAEALGETAREVFQRRQVRPDRLAKVGATQLRRLIFETVAATASGLDEKGEYLSSARALAKAYDLSLSEMERTTVSIESAEALFKG